MKARREDRGARRAWCLALGAWCLCALGAGAATPNVDLGARTFVGLLKESGNRVVSASAGATVKLVSSSVSGSTGPIVRVSKTQDGFRLEISNMESGMSVKFAWGTSDGGDDPANWEKCSEVPVRFGSVTVPFPPGWGDGVSNRARAFILSGGKVISASAVQRPATSLAVTFE